MEAFDAATMFSISAVLLVLSAVDVNADIPDGVVHTDVRKVVAEGNDAVLKCQFRGTPLAVYWKKGSDPESAPNLITGVEGLPSTGSCVEDGACEMADDFSLIVKEAEMEDQGRYICRVVNYRWKIIYNFTDVKVIDRDELRIHTEPLMVGLIGFGVSLPCSFTVEAEKVLWKKVYGDGGSTDEIIFEYTSDGHETPEAGRYGWCKKYGLMIRNIQVSDEGKFICLVSTIDGIEIKNSTILAVHAIQSTWSTIHIILCVLIIVLAIILGILEYGSLINTRQCMVFLMNMLDRINAHMKQQADIERQGLMEQERKLDYLRKKLKNYQPGNATNIENTERFPRVINLGVFGAIGVGKSSLINSIGFALKSTFDNVIFRVSDGGHEVEFEDGFPLTKHINIFYNKGMEELSERQIRDSLIPQICGERGLDSDDGIVTHCPIFVHDIRKPFDPMCIFLKQFTRAVREQYGQNVVVVFTHKDTVDNLEYYIYRTHTFTGIPEEYIWSFENYTENNSTENVEKSIQYLEFLWKCLEIGERNCVE